MSKRFAGTCYIKVDGEQLIVEGSVEIPMQEVNRETKIGSTGVAGYSETPIAPSLKCSAFVTSEFPLEALKAGTDMTITAELANGWVYTLQGAYLVGEIAINASDGNVSLEFNGLKGFMQV